MVHYFQSRRDRGTQTAKDPVACETEKLVYDVVFFTLGKRSALPGDDDVVKCMRHSVAKVLQNHAITFNAMMSRISLNRTVDIQEGFCELTDEVFNEGHVTWARIVTFFAFGARLAVWCTERGMSDLVFEVVSNMSQVAVDRLIPFLRDNGGWVIQNVCFFKKQKYSKIAFFRRHFVKLSQCNTIMKEKFGVPW